MLRLSNMAVAACALAATAMPARAADIVPYEPVPVAPAVLGGWHLRGDIGCSNQEVDELHNVIYEEYEKVDNVRKEFTGAPFARVGVGYRFNN